MKLRSVAFALTTPCTCFAILAASPRSVVTHNVAVPCPRPLPPQPATRTSARTRAAYFTAPCVSLHCVRADGARGRRAYEQAGVLPGAVRGAGRPGGRRLRADVPLEAA